jgi:hypothetical protein
MNGTINKTIKYDPEAIQFLVDVWDELIISQNTFDFHTLPTNIYYELNSILKSNNQHDTICFSYMSDAKSLYTVFTEFKLFLITLIDNYSKQLKFGIQTIYGILVVLVMSSAPVINNLNYFISVFVASIVLYGFITLWINYFLCWLSKLLQATTFNKRPHVLYLSYLIVNCKKSNSVKIKFKDDQTFYSKDQDQYYECIVDDNNRVIEVNSKNQLTKALMTIVNATYVQYVI